MIVIHENRGLTDWVRGVADQLAERGVIAVAPDLLSHQGPNGGGTASFETSDAARDAIYKLDPEQVVAHLHAAVRYAKRIDSANGRVGVCGFCWGGGQTFRFAALSSEITAAYVFYGPAPPEAQLAELAVPVYGFYGGNDFRISGQVPKLIDRLKALGKTYEPVIYEGAGHGFMRAGESPEGAEADRRARDEAWSRWDERLNVLKK